MKICMITSSYPRHAGDGAGSFVGSLARTLVALGHTVHVIAPYDPAVEAMDQGRVHVHRFHYAPGDYLCLVGHARSLQADVRMKRLVPLLMPGFVAAAVVRTLALHRRERFDLLHGHWAVPGGAIAGLVARLTGLPLLISLHGSDVYVLEHSQSYAAIARTSFRRAHRVTACSEDLRARAVAIGLDAAKAIVIPYGVDLARYVSGDGARLRAKLGIPQGALVIGALGRLVHKKGFEHLLAAMPSVLAAFPDAWCVIGGEGDLRQVLQDRAKSLGIAERALFPGHVPRQDTPDFYALCDVFAVPSVIDAAGNVDGLPNVLLEAMASGRPVVASRVAGIPDVLRDGSNGLLVPPGDAQALSRALLLLLRDPTLREELGASAREYAASALPWERVARRFEALYLETLASKD